MFKGYLQIYRGMQLTGVTTTSVTVVVGRYSRKHSPCGCQNPVTSCNLGIFVDQAAEPISPQNPDINVWGWCVRRSCRVSKPCHGL